MLLKIEDEINDLKYLLETGEIDAHEYAIEVQRLFAKQEKRANGRNHKVIDTYTIVSVLTKLFVVASIFFIVSSLMGGSVNPDDYQVVTSLTNIPAPIQHSTNGSAQKIIDGSVVDITYLASYVLQGRVVDIQTYVEYDLEEKLAPLDFGIAWGFMAKDENVEKIKFSSYGNRFLSWNTADRTWLSSNGGWGNIGLYISNNHLIPANDEVKSLLKKVKTDDYVEITGYLVKVDARTKNGGTFWWKSSTSRTDDGDGACELIYVTGIKWLKEA